jgi:hypothetical protein
MLGQVGRLGRSPGGSNAFPSDFFNALNRGDSEGAVSTVRDQFSFTPEVAPSPRAQEMLDNGEWDAKRSDLLRCLDGSNCAAELSGGRFCGKRKCITAAHKKAKGVPPGWYIATTPKCFWAEPCLPLEVDGGPITSGGATLLYSDPDKLKLTKGQWRVVIESWLDAVKNVEAVESAEEEQEPTGSEPARFFPEGDDEEGEDDEAEDDNEPDFRYTRDPFEPVDPFAGTADVPTEQSKALLDMAREVEILKRTDQALKTQLKMARTELAGLAGDLTRAYRQIGGLQDQVTSQAGSLTQLVRRVQRMESEAHLPVPGAVGLQASVESLSYEILDKHGAVHRMKAQIAELNDKFDSGGGIACHGLTFGSQKEFIRWYKAKNIENHAMFMDGVAVLHSISDSVVSDEQYNKTRESQTKNEFDNSLESTMVSSFNTLVPAGLIGGKQVKEGGAAAVQLKRCLATFDVWEPAGMERGLSHEIAAGISHVNGEVLEYQSNCTRDPEVRLLAQGLLGDSVNFCRELILFISVQNKHLTQGTKYTKEQVWGMQLDILLQILQELSQARRGLATSARKEPALYVWAMLKARVIQERLRGNKFEDDVSLNGIIMRKIMLQGGSDALKVKIDKIDEVAKKVADHHRIYNSDVKSLQDRVAKLEKK